MRCNNQNTKTATQTMDAIVPRGIPKTTGRIPSESGRPYNSTSHAPIPRAIMPMTNFETTFIVEMIHIDVAWEKVDHRAGFRDAMSAFGYKQTSRG